MMNWMSNFRQEEKKPNTTNAKNKINSSFHKDNENNKLVLPSINQEKIIQIPDDVLFILKSCEELDFNCFEFNQIYEKKSLVFLMFHLFESDSLFSDLLINQVHFENFVSKISNG